MGRWEAISGERRDEKSKIRRWRASTNTDRNACIFRMSTRAHTCQSPRSRVPGCLKTANVAAKEVPTGRQRGEVKGRHLKNRIKVKYCFVLKSSGGRSDQIGAKSRIISKVKGVIQHKTGCGDWRLWHCYIINTAASSHQGSCCTWQLKVDKIYCMFFYYNASVSSDNLKVRNRTRTVLVHSFITLFDCFCKSKRSL